MSGQTPWDWRDPKRLRRLVTVQDHILWSYAMLSICRPMMAAAKNATPDRFAGSRVKWANIEMSRYQRGERNMTSLDRDDALAQDGRRVCAHCGQAKPPFHWDHLIPRSKLGGETVALNQVRACPPCNLSRGATDLILWHRQRQTFPTLAILRRYLKLCHQIAADKCLLHLPAEAAIAKGLPFDPRYLPRGFPKVHDLTWDFAYPDK